MKILGPLVMLTLAGCAPQPDPIDEWRAAQGQRWEKVFEAQKELAKAAYDARKRGALSSYDYTDILCGLGTPHCTKLDIVTPHGTESVIVEQSSPGSMFDP